MTSWTRGSVVRKPNRRWYVVTNHRDPAGRRFQRWHGGHDSKREAEAVLARTLREFGPAPVASPASLTVEDYFRHRWLPSKQAAVRPSTLDSYRRLLDGHLFPCVGLRRLQTLRPEDLVGLYQKLTSASGLSPKTVRNLHAVIKSGLKDATKWRLMDANPADSVTPPRAVRPQIRTWTAEQAAGFLQSTKGHPLHALWRLALTTGMRRGELLGLRWVDIDLSARQLAVRQTLVSVAYKIELSEPKTPRSRRTIPRDDVTIEALAAHQSSGDGLVFVRPDDEPFHPDAVSKAFTRLVAACELPRIRFHDLRHTFATHALAAGVQPKIVSDLLGHATVAFTLDTYAHALPAAHHHAVTAVADLFGAESDGIRMESACP